MPKEKKITYEAALAASDLVDKFREQSHKQIRRVGVRYIKCQHLQEKTQTREEVAMWIGDKLRIILCPICNNARWGWNMRAFFGTHYWHDEPTEEEKEPERKVNMFEKLWDRLAKLFPSRIAPRE